MNQDLLKIKKYYGENMAHLCRELFPTLLEIEGLLYSLMESNFTPNKALYDDIIDNNLTEEFKDFIYSLIDNEVEELLQINKTPQELLDEVGYILYECKSVKDIEIFEKYYIKDEKLCTFNNKSGRIKENHVFFAVKKNVDEIKRENFTNPKREDEYGTSVMSFQFSKGTTNSLSIKNRYNHTVKNPDSTFFNNLDNIIPGLTKSFEKSYNLNINKYKNKEFGILNLNYGRANDGKFYKYNYEINGIYYCPNNIIIKNHEVIRDYQAKERYILFDYFLLDMKNKEIKLYDNDIKDSFVDGLENIDKIQIKKEKNRKHICLEIEGNTVVITLDKENRIISYKNDIVTEIGDNFLIHNEVLKVISLEKVKLIGDKFLYKNTDLKSIHVPSVVEIRDNFLFKNKSLVDITMESLKKVGRSFLQENESIKTVSFPKLEEVESNFLRKNKGLTILVLPNLIKTGMKFITCNELIREVYLPLLEDIGADFLCMVNNIKKLSLPRARIIGTCFMLFNGSLEILELPILEEIGTHYLHDNRILNTVVIPENMWNSFMYKKSFSKNFSGGYKTHVKIKQLEYC